MFVLNSEVTIGKFRFTGVHEVVIKRSIHSIVEAANIVVPAIAVTTTNGKVSPERVTTATQFKEGDAVTIKLGYNGELRTEFKGFVKNRKLDMPLEIECEGYSWLLRKNRVSIDNKKQDLKSLMASAVTGLEGDSKIRVICDVDLELRSVTLDKPSGFDLVNYITKHTDGNLSCFFTEPDVLWCGCLHAALAKGKAITDKQPVRYRPGYNALKKNTLKPHNVEAAPGYVEYSRRLANGTKIVHVSVGSTKNKSRHVLTLNHVKDKNGLQLLADEKLMQNTYAGYEGHIVTFLQPYAAPGYQAYVKDSVNEALDGTYLIESTEVKFGINGARRIVELGIKIKSEQ